MLYKSLIFLSFIATSNSLFLSVSIQFGIIYFGIIFLKLFSFQNLENGITVSILNVISLNHHNSVHNLYHSKSSFFICLGNV